MGRLVVRADIPDDKDIRKEFVSAGLESGIDRYLIRKEDSDFHRLGRFDAIYSDDDIETVEIKNPESQEYAMSLSGKKKIVMVKTDDWKIIPLENIIGCFHSSGTELYAVAKNVEDAKLFLTTLEKGVDAVVIDVVDLASIRSFAELEKQSPAVALSEVEIESVESAEMGDRVCIDTCVSMSPGEGMLIGSHSDCLFLVQSESEDSGYVSSRPFRVNAGAIHSYIQAPEDRTNYLSEMRSGKKVLICDSAGKTRVATVGRCKIEKRPMLIVSATDGKRNYSIILQNAETVRLVTADGSKPVTELKKGDNVLAKLSAGGKHFGMTVDETVSEI